MSTIRSAPPPMIPPRPTSDARAAFFRGVAPAEAAQRQPLPAQAPATPPPQPTQAAAAPRVLRPGSIIDIKV